MSLDLVEYAKAYETKNHSLCEWKMKYYIQITLLVLKYKFGNRHFWSEGYYVSTVGLNEQTIRKYIRDQEKHDLSIDKLTTKEYSAPF